MAHHIFHRGSRVVGHIHVHAHKNTSGLTGDINQTSEGKYINEILQWGIYAKQNGPHAWVPAQRDKAKRRQTTKAEKYEDMQKRIWHHNVKKLAKMTTL